MATPPPPPNMTGICFKDQLWLSSYPLDRNLVFDYFAISPFYDWTCNNEQLRQRAIHPLDLSHLSKMTGTEYMLTEVTEPHLFVIRKQKRDSPEKGRALYHINKAFTTASTNLEKIGYVDPENEIAVSESKASKETVDFREFNRVNQILQSLMQKLPPAPPPPPFPEGYVPAPTGEAENGSETQQTGEPQQPPVDPIIDQGPSKRMKF